MSAYPDLRLYIGGEWKAADGQPVINPANESVLGSLSINHLTTSIAKMPFGGVKESGYGREGGSEGLLCYTVAKNASHLVL
jgi:acyl-CoA reductase-like NAD-dependent aldehyde dehydrogenase